MICIVKVEPFGNRVRLRERTRLKSRNWFNLIDFTAFCICFLCRLSEVNMYLRLGAQTGKKALTLKIKIARFSQHL